MTNNRLLKTLLCLTLLFITPTAFAQNNPSPREKTRERMNALLQRSGPDISVNFQPSPKNPFVFTGVLNQGLTNSQSMEIVITVTDKDTLAFRIFPHYNGGYINLDKAQNPAQLMRRLVQFNNSTFLYWGADDQGDVFTGYTFTLESGFPDAALVIVLGSIKNSDQFVGQLRPLIDGSAGK